ncbi:MAG: hypothetical protein Q4P33_05935, partial [Flaviflexus sp.]|nr:hypothetical protein [Flaviflexus sp.]
MNMRKARRALAGGLAMILGTSAFVSLGISPAAADSTDLITTDTTWTYNETDTDPAPGDDRLAWARPGFDTSDWKEARGAFGAKRGKGDNVSGFPFETLLTQYAADGDNVRTFHFVTEVELTAEDLERAGLFEAETTFDDAVQVFVNGTKVAGFVDKRVEAVPESERNLMYA